MNKEIRDSYPWTTEEDQEDDDEHNEMWLGASSLDLIVEAKVGDDGKRGSLLSLEAFQAMIDFHDFVLNITSEAPEDEKMISFYDLCER